MSNRAEILKQRYQQSVGLPFAQVLSESEITKVLEEQGVSYRQVLYTPMVVLWAWISQVLDEDKSLSNAVKRVTTWLTAAGEERPSSDTGGYSKARKRLRLGVLPALVKRSAEALEGEVSPKQLWCGRRVKAFDGTSLLMSDTPANQKRYPQHRQKEGCGFPIARVVVWFCGVSGAVLEAAIAPFNTSEWQLSRQLYATLCPEDVVVADRAYGTYADLALVQKMGADGLFRKHQSRQCDFRRGKKLGIGDHLVSWQRPQKCPKSIPHEEFDALPTQLAVREVHFLHRRPGFRPVELILVTTLRDPKVYTKDKLAALYELRWQATEVNFKHLKTTLKMEMIAAKTPDTVQKEFWVHLLAYNLLRTLMWQASKQAPVSPLRISLQGARQQLNHFRPLLAGAQAPEQSRLYNSLLTILAELLVPLRPHRAEPRVLKRRPKPFPRMQQPRAVLKAKLAA